MSQPQENDSSSLRKHFFQQAATFSLFTPAVVIILNFAVTSIIKNSESFTSQVDKTGFYVAALGLFSVLAALILGIISFFGIKKEYACGIRRKAITGIVLNSLFLLCFVGLWLILPRLKNPDSAIDNSLSTNEYTAYGVPSPAGPWGGIEYGKAAEGLQNVAATNINALPRWKSSKSGEIFARMIDERNLKTLGEEVTSIQAKLFATAQLLLALQKLGNLYNDTTHQGANYSDENIELARYVLLVLVQFDSDMNALLASIPKSDSRYQLISRNFEERRAGMRICVEASIDILTEGHGLSNSSRVRYADYLRDLLPPLLHVEPADQRKKMIDQIISAESTVADPDLKSAMAKLCTVMEPAK